MNLAVRLASVILRSPRHPGNVTRMSLAPSLSLTYARQGLRELGSGVIAMTFAN